MLKKIIATTLMLTLILSNISTIYANQSTVLDNYDDMESYVVFGKEYSIYSNTLEDGSIEKKVINPDGTCESFKFIDNVLYDINGKVIATFHEEVVNFGNNYSRPLSKEQLMSVMSYYESEDPPYPISDYSIHFNTIQGNVALTENIKNISVGTLVLIIGWIAPPVGMAMSAMLIEAAIKTDINQYAIFYVKDQYHHKSLGSLAKRFKVQWYWDPGYTVKAGGLNVYYSTFM